MLAKAIRLQVEDVGKRYGTSVALHDVSFTLHAGEVLALVGRNGAGKTTLMRIVADELEPTYGHVHWHDSRFMYVPDETILYEHLTGREYLHFICVMSGVPKRQAGETVETRLREAYLLDAANHLTKTYSLGMRRQLSIAAAFIQEPDVLILDEITNGLDPVANAHVKQQLRTLADSGKAILLSSHLLDVVVDVADRVLVMDEGTTRYLGPLPAQVKATAGLSSRHLESFYLSLLQKDGDVL